jgi:protein dithiol:quinone oxidoreductase
MIAALVRHRRLVCLGAGLFSLGLVAYAIIELQNAQGLEPCPLCIFQRVGLAILGGTLLLAALPPTRMRGARWLTLGLVALAALGTAGISLRHIWIQSQPPGSVPACGATLDYLWDVFPIADVVRKVLTGSGECSRIDWSFLGITMPGWVLIWAVVLAALALVAGWPRTRRPAA